MRSSLLFRSLIIVFVISFVLIMLYRAVAMYYFQQLQPNEQPYLHYEWQGIRASNQSGSAQVLLSYNFSEMDVMFRGLKLGQKNLQQTHFHLNGQLFWPVLGYWRQSEHPWFRNLKGVNNIDFDLEGIRVGHENIQFKGNIQLDKQYDAADANGMQPMVNAYLYMQGNTEYDRAKMSGMLRLNILDNPFPLDAFDHILVTNPKLWSKVWQVVVNEDVDRSAFISWLSQYSVDETDFQYQSLPSISDQQNIIKVFAGFDNS
ncbi:MAG: hypothetical protein ACON5A_05155 [Candidatus Comchoanobacterales bacterium]